MAKLVLPDRTASLLERGLAALALLSWLLLICSGSVGCDNSRHPLASYQIVADVSVSANYLLDLQQIAADLCRVTDGEKCFSIDRTVSVYTRNTLSVGDLPDNTLGRTIWTDDRVEIILEDRPGFVPTARHELGHAAGCWTHLSPENVITKSTKRQDLWTDLDLRCILEEWDDESTL